MERRGFIAAALAFLAVPAFAQSRRKVPIYGLNGRVRDSGFPEYRKLGATDYMRVNRTYWTRRAPLYGNYPREWRPCSRAVFYRARELYPRRSVLPPNYKSPAQSWWESYLKKLYK